MYIFVHGVQVTERKLHCLRHIIFCALISLYREEGYHEEKLRDSSDKMEEDYQIEKSGDIFGKCYRNYIYPKDNIKNI